MILEGDVDSDVVGIMYVYMIGCLADVWRTDTVSKFALIVSISCARRPF